MEIIKMIALALGAILLLASCSSNDSYALEYQEHPFCALIAFESGGLSATALLSVIPKTDSNGEVARDVTLSFRSPDSLKNVTVEKRKDNITASCGDLTISDTAISSWLQVADLFNIDGTVKRTYISELQGESYNCIEALGTDGKEYKIYLNSRGEPRRIASASLTVDVLSFENTM